MEIARFFNLGDEVCNSTKPKMIAEISKYIQRAEKEAKARAKADAAQMQGKEAQEEEYTAEMRAREDAEEARAKAYAAGPRS